MLLEALEAQDLRNLQGKIELGEGLNILVGENGQGKTNWLEAIHILATTRSFRTAKLNEAIRFGKELAIVRGRVWQSENIRRELQVGIEKASKAVFVNGKRESPSNYLGQLNAVVFNSDELEVIRGHPEARRRFLDNGIVSLHPPFLQIFTDFLRVIRQKNSLLAAAREVRQSLESTEEQLAPWNAQLVSLAVRIHKSRIRYVERLNEVLEKKLFGREELSVRYVSSLEGKGDISEYGALLTDRLKLRIQAEAIAGHSLVGPHRDDLEILFDGQDIRKFGSAGQQRSAFLLLLLANIGVYFAARGEYPLLLLDDIDAELDYRRVGRLFEFLSGRSQTIATTSKLGFVAEFGASASVFAIRDGAAERLSAAAP